MMLVIDASVAVKFLVRDVKTEAARRLLAAPEPLIAPDWLLVEAANTFWRKVERAEMLAVHAERHLETLPAFFAELAPAARLVEPALRWSFRLRHPVYDCLYLALALERGTRLVTADERFHAIATTSGLVTCVELLV